mmetsp:Transcript_17834/g.39528  ORF Transcript_17834/g.39528 Transcript_17834/m.39528 type:complete len:221 (+) Transcript_17834:2811-3473(+)
MHQMLVVTEPRSTSPSMRSLTRPVSSSRQRTAPSLPPAKSSGCWGCGWKARLSTRLPDVGNARANSSAGRAASPSPASSDAPYLNSLTAPSSQPTASSGERGQAARLQAVPPKVSHSLTTLSSCRSTSNKKPRREMPKRRPACCRIGDHTSACSLKSRIPGMRAWQYHLCAASHISMSPFSLPTATLLEKGSAAMLRTAEGTHSPMRSLCTVKSPITANV